MATVNVLTAERTLAIEANTVVDGSVDNAGHLILTKQGGGTIDAGVVRSQEVSGTSYMPERDDLYTGTAPTISTAQTTTPTSGYIKHSPNPVALSGSDVRGAFSWAGAGNFAIGTVSPDTNYVLPLSRYPNTYASGQGNWSVQFSTNAAIIQVRFKYISSATMYRLHINGRRVTSLMQSSGGITAGSGHMLTIDFGSSAHRDIRLDFTTFPFGGVYIPPGASLWSSPPVGGRFMVLGDSITDGSAQNTGAGQGTWLMRAGRMLGIRDIWEQGRGGTGYITPGSHATFGDRLAADIVAWNPSKLIVWGGYNDNSGDQLVIRAAVDSVLNTIKTELPMCRTLILGCWAPTGSPGASIVNTDETIRAAADAAAFPFASPITGNVYGSTGDLIDSQGPWINAQNSAAFVGGDGVHPNNDGHEYIARRVIAAMHAAVVA